MASLAGLARGLMQLRGAGGQQAGRFGDVAPGRGRADAEPGGQLGTAEEYAKVQVGALVQRVTHSLENR